MLQHFLSCPKHQRHFPTQYHMTLRQKCMVTGRTCAHTTLTKISPPSNSVGCSQLFWWKHIFWQYNILFQYCTVEHYHFRLSYMNKKTVRTECKMNILYAREKNCNNKCSTTIFILMYLLQRTKNDGNIRVYTNNDEEVQMKTLHFHVIF